MNVSDLMAKEPLAVAPDLPLADAIGLMAQHALRHLPVVERGALVGIVSERDLLEATGWNPDRYLVADGRPRVVRDSMSVAVETAAPDEELRAAVVRLLDRRIGCLPVVDAAGRLAGVVTVADLLALFARADASAAVLDAVVASRMSQAPVTLDAGASVSDALEACREHDVRHLPVTSDGWFVGLVSDRDLRLQTGRGEPRRRVQDIMSTHLATVGPESLVSDAVELMRRRRVDSIPVAREGKLIGMLTTADVLRLLRDRLVPRPLERRAGE
jgi:acetoin utilization protein AcuB